MKAVKEYYIAIVIALNNETHQPEALGISSSKSTVSAVYLLDYVLPLVAKLSRTLQSKKLDLTQSYLPSWKQLCSLDDALNPAANWVLDLQETTHSLEEATSVDITTFDIQTFQTSVGNSTLKDNISSRVISVHKTQY